MKWIKERDALIAQTMAFVQSVSGGQETVSQFGPGSQRAATAKPLAEPEPVALESQPGAPPYTRAGVCFPCGRVPLPKQAGSGPPRPCRSQHGARAGW